jgi:hypothetical protein
VTGEAQPVRSGLPRPIIASPYAAALAASIILLGVLAAVYLLWPIWRALFPLEIDVDEAWNAYNADAVLSGRALYPDPSSLIANNYPPLSFYLVAALSQTGLDAVYVGRFLSLISVVTIALAVASCIRQLGGTRLAATVGSFWLLATSARFFDYVGKNDPHLPAVAITVTALAWFLRRDARGRAAEPAILLMAVAGFYKHSLIATPAAAILWLGIGRWRLALRAAVVGAGAAAAGLLLCVAVYGTDFISQLMFARELSLPRALDSLWRLQWIAPALILVVVWVWYDRQSQAARFTAIYLATSLLTYLLQKFGAGVGDNAQFELIAATAIGLGLTFSRITATPLGERWGAERSRVVLVALLVLRLLASGRTEPYLVLASSDYRAFFRQATQAMWSEVERVRQIPGPLDCEVMSVCRLAGKPFVYDPFAMEQRVRTGKLSRDELDALRKAQGIRGEPVAVSVRPIDRRQIVSIPSPAALGYDTSRFPSINMNSSARFAGGENSGALISGWSSPEPWGVWSDGVTAELGIVPQGIAGKNWTLQIACSALVAPGAPMQKVEVWSNTTKVAEVELSRTAFIAVQVAAGALADGSPMVITLKIPHAISPNEIAGSKNHDRRKLGIGLISLRLIENTGTAAAATPPAPPI